MDIRNTINRLQRCWRSTRSPVQLALIFSLLLTSTLSYGQYISNAGRFEVDQVTGCAPLKVNITSANLTPGNVCPVCAMTFEPGQQVQNTFTWTYNTPGTYLLSVLYQNTGADNISITVLQNIQPDFEIFTCSGNKVTVRVTDTNYDKYYIDYGDGSPRDSIPSSANQVDSHAYAASGNYSISINGRKLNGANNCSPRVKPFQALAVLPAPQLDSLRCLDATSLKMNFQAHANLELHLEIALNNSTTFQLFQSLYGVTADTVRNITVDQNYYCFRLSAFDPCTGVNTYSNIVCSQQFSAVAQSDVNQLAWITSTSGLAANYDITRNGAIYVTTPPPIQSYNDVDILCQTKYCYRVTSHYAGSVRSISLTKCVTAFSSKVPTLIENSSAVVSDNGVELTWLPDPAFTTTNYTILRDQNSGSFGSVGTSSALKYDDSGYTTQGNFCYEINYTDQCGNNSAPGATICPIRLGGSLEKTNAVDLTWNNYEGWKNGVKNYTLDKYDSKGNLLKTWPMGTTTYTDTITDRTNQVVSYQVTAIPNDGGLVNSVSNMAIFIKETNLWYPTAFTPNNDGKNDTFSVNGFYLTRLELNIFNRWGTLIFSTEKNEPWDGTFNGKMMPNDTYVWTAKGTDLAGQTFAHSGTVVLLTPAR